MASPSPFDSLYGLELLACTPDRVEGSLAIEPRVTQPFGVVHGGVYASMAEALTSHGTNVGVADRGAVALGLSNYTNLLRPVRGGHLIGVAHPRHRGRTTWVWDVNIEDEKGRLCCTSRVTLAVRLVSSIESLWAPEL